MKPDHPFFLSDCFSTSKYLCLSWWFPVRIYCHTSFVPIFFFVLLFKLYFSPVNLKRGASFLGIWRNDMHTPFSLNHYTTLETYPGCLAMAAYFLRLLFFGYSPRFTISCCCFFVGFFCYLGIGIGFGLEDLCGRFFISILCWRELIAWITCRFRFCLKCVLVAWFD